MAIAYLAGPIDLAHDGFQGWKIRCKGCLGTKGITTIDPAGTFSYAQSANVEDRINTAKALIRINEHNLKHSDMAIILLSKETPSIGTPIELAYCHRNNIPNVVIFDGDPGAMLPAYIEGMADAIVFDVDSALEHVIARLATA